jgi:long-chain acyl-CoA synthetase
MEGKIMNDVGTFLKETVARYGSKPALVHKPDKVAEVWSYERMWDDLNRVAAWLQDLGVEKGDRVVLWASNSPHWVTAYMGILRLGAIVVPLDLRSSPDFVQRVVGQTEPKLALTSRAKKEGGGCDAPCFVLEDILPSLGAEVRQVNAECTPDDIAVLMFTSGTTGDPKGVILTHGNILASLIGTDQVVPNIKDFRVVSLLPLSHVFEQIAGLLLALKRGSSIYYISSLQPAVIFDALKEHKATAMLLVPAALQLFMSSIEREVAKQGKETQWRRLQQIARFSPRFLRKLLFKPVQDRLGGRLEFLVSGGAPIAPELLQKWELLGIPVIQGYGTTEATSVVAVTTLENRNPYTVGEPIPGMELKLTEDGEILLRGAAVTQGYWRNPRATEEAFERGWYKTGDLGEVDARGHLRILGRKKDLIVLHNGMNVYPEDVERAVKAEHGIADAIVLGMPTDEGAQVHAVMILEPDAPDPRDIVRQANARLAPHQSIRGYTVWPDKEFPRTHTLKVKKHEVLKSVQEIQVREKAPLREEVPALAGSG